MQVSRHVGRRCHSSTTYPCLHCKGVRKLVEHSAHVPDGNLYLHDGGRVLIHTRLPLVARPLQRRRAARLWRASVLEIAVAADGHLGNELRSGHLVRMCQVRSYLQENGNHSKDNEAHEHQIDTQLQPLGQDGGGARVVANGPEKAAEPALALLRLLRPCRIGALFPVAVRVVRTMWETGSDAANVLVAHLASSFPDLVPVAANELSSAWSATPNRALAEQGPVGGVGGDGHPAKVVVLVHVGRLWRDI